MYGPVGAPLWAIGLGLAIIVVGIALITILVNRE
jgi:hypothetical protein